MTEERKYKVTGLDSKLAQKLINEFDTDLIVSQVEFLKGGKSSSNYKVSFKGTHDQLLIRIMPVKDKTCFKEFMLYQYLNEFVPIPEVYLVNDACNIIDKPYQIVEFVEGKRMSELIETTQDFPIELIRETAEYLALIHRTSYEKEGALSADLEITDDLPPILHWYDHFLDNKAGERLGSDLKKKVQEWLINKSTLMQEMIESFVLSHGDFRPDNILVINDKISAIIDWEGALSAPASFDIGQFFRNDEFYPRKTERIFAEAYNSTALKPIQGNWKEKAKLMDLVNLLCLLDLSEENPVWFQYLTGKVKETLKYY